MFKNFCGHDRNAPLRQEGEIFTWVWQARVSRTSLPHSASPRDPELTQNLVLLCSPPLQVTLHTDQIDQTLQNGQVCGNQPHNTDPLPLQSTDPVLLFMIIRATNFLT